MFSRSYHDQFLREQYNGAVSQLLEIIRILEILEFLITFENSMKCWHSEIILSRGSSGIAITVLVCGNLFVWMCARIRACAVHCSVCIFIADVFPVDIWLHLMEGKRGFRIRKLTRGF